MDPSQQLLKSTRLGTAPLGKLIVKMSAPAMISMLVQALYNTVDSIFVSHSSQAALTALSLAFPMQLLVLAFSLGLGIGVNSVISRRLGEGRNEDAGKAAQNGLFIAIVFGILFAIIGYFISKVFIGLYTDDAQIYTMGYQYLSICVCCMLFACVEICLNRTLQAMGNMIVPMICQLVGAITNIVLDPILIFGWLGCPALGVTGAAIATVVGQFVAMVVAIIVVAVKRKSLDIKIFNIHFKPEWTHIKQILRVGLPALVMNAIGSIMYLIANFILISFSGVAVSVFGVYFKLQSLVFMPTFGLNQGIIPILGYNYGANNKARFVKTFRISLIAAFVIMSLGLILFQAIPAQIMSLFNADAEMMSMGVVALRICSACFLPAAISVILIAMFNAIGHGIKAMLISLLRQLVLLLPIGYVLTLFMGVTGFWTAFPIAEAIAVLIFFPIAIVTIRNIFRKKDEETAKNLAQSATDAVEMQVE